MNYLKKSLILVLLIFSFTLVAKSEIFASNGNYKIVEEKHSTFFNFLGKKWLTYGNHKIDIYDYDFYEEHYNSKSTKTYIADVLKDKQSPNGIILMYIYSSKGSLYPDMLNVQILDSLNHKIINTLSWLSYGDSSSLLVNSKKIDLLQQKGELVSRLLFSKSFTDRFVKKNSYGNEFTKNVVESSNLVSDRRINYDPTYTSSKYMDDESKISNFYTDSTYMVNGKISDHHIIDTIPRSLFTSIGKYFYIGSHYGFVMETTYSGLFGAYYQSNILLFTINFKKHVYAAPKKRGYLEILPKKQRGFATYYANRDTNVYDQTNTFVITSNDAVINKKLYVANPSFKHSVRNLYAKNVGDVGYNVNLDRGVFFTEARLSFQGIGLTRYSGSWASDLLELAVGFVDPSKGIVPYLVKHVAGSTSNITYEHNSENFVVELPTTRYDQLLHLNNTLARSINITQKTFASEKIMFGENHYVRSTYVVDSENLEWHNYFINSVYLEGGEDNSYSRFFGWFKGGGFDKFGSGSVIFSDLKRATTSYGSQYFELNQNAKTSYIEFYPTNDGTHTFETIKNGTSIDTVMELYDETGKLLASDDDSGESLYSKLSYLLEKNKKYTIFIHEYRGNNGGFYLNVVH